MESHLETSLRHHLDLICKQLANTKAQLKGTQDELHETKNQLDKTKTQLHSTQEQMRIKKLEGDFDTSMFLWKVERV